MAEGGHLYALLIGVNQYDTPSLRPLQFAVTDVVEFEELLRTRLGLQEARCRRLTSASADPGARPTRNGILSALDRFAATWMTAEDTFVFYFAGHGFAVDGETFLMASDSEPGSAHLLRKTALPLAGLEQSVRGIRAGQQLVIVDACRNEPHGRGRGTAGAGWDNAMTRDMEALAAGVGAGAAADRPHCRGRAILSACWEGSVSFEYPAKGHSWFCHHLIESVRHAQGDAFEVGPRWVEQIRQRMRRNAPVDLPEAAQQEPHLILQGDPIRLELALVGGSDPADVVVCEASIEPLRVAVESVALEQVQGPDLPPIAGDLLEVEGRLAALQQTVEQLENGTHPGLAPAQQAVREMEDQWETLSKDLEANTPFTPPQSRRRVWIEVPRLGGSLVPSPRLSKAESEAESWQRLQAEAVKTPLASVSQLCALAPGIPTAVLLPYVQRLRNADRARAALARARADSEAVRQREVDRLREEAAALRPAFLSRKEEDLAMVLDRFFERLGDPPEFPLESWNAFEPLLLRRRYPWSDRETLERAERRSVERRDRRAWETARAAPPTEAAVQEYLDRWPGGRHRAQAQALLTELKEESAWQRLLAAPGPAALTDFLCEFPNGRHAAEAQAMLVEAEQDTAWFSVARSGDAAQLAAFIDAYPRGRHGAEARQRLAALEDQARREAERQRVRRRWRVILRALAVLVAGVAVGILAVVVDKRRKDVQQQQAGPVVTEAPRNSALRTNSLGMRFVPVPGTAVWFSIWETRVRDYAAYAAANPGVDESWREPMVDDAPPKRTNDCPVINVSWHDARGFCRWLTEKERGAGLLTAGQEYRLPLDAEWSAAVDLDESAPETVSTTNRAGEVEYPWGRRWPPSAHDGNYADRTARQTFPEGTAIEYEDGFATTAPVGSFKPNRHGLYDLGGNVWEWCEDWNIPGNPDRRVLRGASWGDHAHTNIASAQRRIDPAQLRLAYIGFRCVLGTVH